MSETTIVETLSVAECPYCKKLVTNKGDRLPDSILEMFEKTHDQSILKPMHSVMFKHFADECVDTPLLVNFANLYVADMFAHIQSIKNENPIRANVLAHNLGSVRDAISGDTSTTEYSRTNPDGYEVTHFKITINDEGDLELIREAGDCPSTKNSKRHDGRMFLPFAHDHSDQFLVLDAPAVRSHTLWPPMVKADDVTHMDILSWMREA